MLIGSSTIFATLLSSLCLLTAVQRGNSQTVLTFADSDLRVLESDSDVTTSVRVSGDTTEDLIVTITPLTVAQYEDDPGRYQNRCDTAVATSSVSDSAEAKDFSRQQQEVEVPSSATSQGQDYTFSIDINLVDDGIRELNDEYFLLFLNASQSPSVDEITYDSSRGCLRVIIESDQDEFVIGYVPLIDPIVVSEDAGTVEIIRVEKRGQIEQPVDITFTGGSQGIFMISPITITLQPSQRSAFVNVTVIDNQDAEGDYSFSTIGASSQFGSSNFPITIREDDRFLIGFDQSEVTVTEGETVTLTISYSRDVNLISFGGNFMAFTQQGMGNATEMIHYTKLNTTISVDKNAMGDPQIEVSTIDTLRLERPRQFEVKLTYSVPAPFISIQPDTVTITIKDKGGIPGKPTISSVRQEEDDLTVTWTIDKDELRPVDAYVVKIQIPGSRDQDSEFNTTVEADKANCKPNGTKYHCMFTIMGRKLDDGKTYDITVCARNVLGQNCSEPLTPIPPKPSTAPLLPTGSILGIVFGVIVAVLACCLIVMLVALIVCCCGCAEREKVYNPEKKEKQNEKLRNKEMYTKTEKAESPTNEYEFV